MTSSSSISLNANQARQSINSRLSPSKSPNYTCEDEIRRRCKASNAVRESATKKKPQGGDAMVESWIKIAAAKAQENGTLMTSQQYEDWSMRRRLTPGDAAVFIGDAREERLVSGDVAHRPTGQHGHIVSAVKDNDPRGELITFLPDDPIDVVMLDGSAKQSIVPLIVRQHTRDWLDLERVPT